MKRTLRSISFCWETEGTRVRWAITHGTLIIGMLPSISIQTRVRWESPRSASCQVEQILWSSLSHSLSQKNRAEEQTKSKMLLLDSSHFVAYFFGCLFVSTDLALIVSRECGFGVCLDVFPFIMQCKASLKNPNCILNFKLVHGCN